MPDLSGLGDLGFLKPTMSNKSDDINKVDLLAQMLDDSSEMYDEVGRARVLESQMEKLQAQEQPSLLDRILSPEGLISLLATGAAGAIGGPAAAAGFGLGRLGGMDAATEADKAQKRKAMEELSEQHEKALDRLDKSRQRFTTLLQAQPELFIDPATGEQTVPPKLLGFYATGEPVALSALTKDAIEQTTAAREKVHATLTTRLETAASDEDARTILKAMFTNLKSPVDDGTLEALVQARKMGTLEAELANVIAERYPRVAAEVFMFAGDNKLNLWDTRIAKMLTGNYVDPDAADGDDDVSVSDEFLRIGKKIADYQMDPKNHPRIAQLQSEATSPMEFSLALAREVLPLDPEYNIYRREARLYDPKDLEATFKQFGEVKQDNQMADGISGYEQLPTRRAMTQQEKDQADWRTARERVIAGKKAAKKNQANAELSVVAKQQARLQSGTKMTPREAGAMMLELAKAAKAKATRPDGLVDQTHFEQELSRLVDEKIANKPSE